MLELREDGVNDVISGGAVVLAIKLIDHQRIQGGGEVRFQERGIIPVHQ